MALADLIAAADRAYAAGTVKPLDGTHLQRDFDGQLCGCVLGAAFVEATGQGTGPLPSVEAIESFCVRQFGLVGGQLTGLIDGFDNESYRELDEPEWEAAVEAGAALRRKWLLGDTP